MQITNDSVIALPTFRSVLYISVCINSTENSNLAPSTIENNSRTMCGCLCFTVSYPLCGHSGQPEYRPCTGQSSHQVNDISLVISEESEFNGFCPECFLLPDPRDSPGHQLQGKSYSHDISEFDDRVKVLVENLYSHNADHLKTNSQDLLAFVKQSGQQLYEHGPGFRVSQDQVLESTFWKLMADFWVKLDAGHCPPLE